MKGVLLDTHTFLWVASGSTELSQRVKQILAMRSTVVYVSVVSLWEIAIKVQAGKFEFDDPLDVVIQREFEHNGYVRLNIQDRHLAELLRQPTPAFAHGDPFDRLLVAQEVAEGLDILSRDAKLDAYGARRVW